MPRPFHRVVLIAVIAAYVVLFVGSLSLAVANRAAAGRNLDPADAVLVAAFAAIPLVGALIEWHQRGNRIGRLLIGIGLGTTVAVASVDWAEYSLRAHPGSLPGGRVAAWLATWALVPSFGCAAWLFAMFPSGRIVTRWLCRLGWFAAVGLGAVMVAQALAPGPIDGLTPGVRPILNPLGIGSWRGALATITTVGVLLVVVFLVSAIADLVIRYRRSVGEARLQMRWLAVATPVLPVAMIVGGALPPRVGEPVQIAGQVVFLVGTAGGIAVAVLRYRLYELDVFVRQSLVFAALSALVVGGYVAIVAATSAVLANHAEPVPSLFAAGVVAVAFQPARARVQHAVDRVVYGRRAEPYAVLSALGERAELAGAPDEILSTIVETIAAELRLGSVAIEADDGTVLARHSGTPDGGDGSVERFPVVYQGRARGALVVGTRTPGEPLTVTERRLLADLARQAGAASYARELISALQHSREQLVADREEDRRRIRRDLHDGLGPALAGMLLRVDVAADLLSRRPGEARRELDVLKQQLRDSTEEIRRVVHGLRPPALDELGLVAALRAQALSLASPGGTNALTITVEAPDTSTPLPAAVEVAVLRVAGEAVTNVVRHAHARSCMVRLVIDGAVDLEVVDDGVGIPADPRPGIGLHSMRERAAELGGTLEVALSNGRGTQVHLRLPLVEST